MNLSRSPFSVSLSAASAVAVMACAASLAGCATPFGSAKIDPTSPVAAEVARANKVSGKLPTFASIPKAPDDIRPLPRYGGAANEVKSAAAALVAATDPGTWTLQGTDDFAAKARAAVGPELPPVNPADAEAFARGLRERATPPPPR